MLYRLGADGAPHGMAMWFLHTPDAILMLTVADLQKVRNLRRDPRVAVVAESVVDGGPRGVSMRGRAEILDESPEPTRLRRGDPCQVPSAARAALGRPRHAVQSHHVQDRAQLRPQLGAAGDGGRSRIPLPHHHRSALRPAPRDRDLVHPPRGPLLPDRRARRSGELGPEPPRQPPGPRARGRFELRSHGTRDRWRSGAGAMQTDPGALREEVRLGRRSDRGDHPDRPSLENPPPPTQECPPEAKDTREPQAVEKGPDARQRPQAAREAWSLHVERAAAGANEAGGPYRPPAAADRRGCAIPGSACPCPGRCSCTPSRASA